MNQQAIKDWCFILALSVLMFLPSLNVFAADSVGYKWGDNCYSDLYGAFEAYSSEMRMPVYFSIDSTHAGRQLVIYDRPSNTWTRFFQSGEMVDGLLTWTDVGFLVFNPSDYANQFYSCVIPENPTALAGNGQPSVFSPLYETAKTLGNTQSLMIFLWLAMAYFMGFKFGYFMINIGGSGRHDVI